MNDFRRLLSKRQPDPTGTSWLFVPYDQLSDGMGPLSREAPSTLGVILVENTWKAARPPYHKQKLGPVLINTPETPRKRPLAVLGLDKK